MKKTVSKYFLSLLLPVIFISANSISAQSQKIEFPQTPLGNVIKEWFALINNGSENQLKEFIETKFSEEVLKRENAAAITKLYQKLQRQSGGLEVIEITPPVGEFPMRILAKSKRGNNFVSITTGMRGGDKLAGLGIDKTVDPNEKRLAESFPQPLSESQIIGAIKDRVQKLAAENRFSGVVLIAGDDRVLFQNAYGYANRETKEKITLDTKFHLASVGKMFTAISIAQLVKAGKISYGDPVSKFLPDFPNEEIKKITIHQLLTHTAGMGTFFESPGFTKGKIYKTSTEEIEVYKDEKLFFAPGNRWRYSNAGYSLLGAIIERVTGKTYLEYVRENLFKPLKLDDKASVIKTGNPRSLSVLYAQSDDDPLGIELFQPVAKPPDSFGTGFGGGYMSAIDLFKFARAYRTGKLIGTKMTQELVSGKIEESAGSTTCWGYGIKERLITGEIVRGHSGGGRTDVQMIWDENYTIIVQTNAVPPPATALSGEILDFLTKQISLRKSSL